MITVSVPTRTPPCWMMGTIERRRCWFIPMRPVTPFMMIPTVWVVMPCLSRAAEGALPRAERGASTPARGSVPSSSCRQCATSPPGA